MKQVVFALLWFGVSTVLLATPAEITNDIFVDISEGYADFYEEQNEWDFVLIGRQGAPGLPAFSVYFVLPDDVDIDSISVFFDNVEEKEVGTCDVLPNPPRTNSDGSVDWDDGTEGVENGRYMPIYSKDGYVFDRWVVDWKVSSWKSVNLLYVTVLAYDWNPTSEILKKFVRGSLHVDYSSPNSSVVLGYPSSTAVDTLRSLAVDSLNMNDISFQSSEGYALF